MGLNGLEPSTSRLSGVRSNQLSYKPKFLVENRFSIYRRLPWFSSLSFFYKCGNHLFSRAVSRQVSSAV